MGTTTKHNRFSIPATSDAGKTTSFDNDFLQVEAGRTIYAVANQTIAQYAVVYLDAATAQFKLALDDSPGEKYFAITASTGGTACYAQVDGVVTNAAWGLSPGALVYC